MSRPPCVVRAGPGWGIRLLPVVFAVLFPLILDAQAVITGTVREDSSGRPIAGVEVVLLGTGRSATTNVAGRYSLNVTPGGYVALFRKIGFRGERQMARAADGDTVWVNALMVSGEYQLPDVEVVAEEKRPRGFGLEAFEERRKMGFGKFITPDTLRKLEQLKAADVLRRFTTIELVPGAQPGQLWAAGNRKPPTQATGGKCWMQVILDGNVIFRPERYQPGGPIPPGLSEELRPDFNRDFAVSELEAIEVYYGAGSTPSEFSGTSAACGTIVLWSRRGLKP